MASSKKDLKTPARAHKRPAPARTKVAPPTVSGRWLLIALCTTFVAAVICAWGTMCLLFWQGSWQLLYRPSNVVARTPASIALPFSPIGFAATETGELRLQGWWIPAAPGARFANLTVLYLHGAQGNLSDDVHALAALHAAGVTVFAFDYRGYGRSQFTHPSEATWRQDADWAIAYLTGTRQIDPHTIVLDGVGLGADLAAEVASAHSDLAGVVLDSPIPHAADIIFNDPRAHIVPAHILVQDRWDLTAAAASIRIPSLWLIPAQDDTVIPAYRKAWGHKTLFRTSASEPAFNTSLTSWLAGLKQ